MKYTNLSPTQTSRLYVIVFLSAFLMVLVWLNKSVNPAIKMQRASALPFNGSVYLQTVNKENRVALDQPLDLLAYATSEGREIVGYDVVFNYDEESLEIVDVQSLLPDFSIYPLKKDTYYVVTGAKSISSQSNSVFSQTPILKITARPLKAGATIISVQNIVEVEKTQLVDDKTQILYPRVSELTLSIY